jgi:ribonucleoside-diphosphate reductase alpha chain
MVEAAWHTGDPGLLFLDRINRANPTPHLGPIEATNPCGEIPLLPHESCNLGSINLAHMLDKQRDQPTVDRGKRRATTRTAVRFLDDVIEVNKYPRAEIERLSRGNRKMGLGVMGFADMLIQLGMSYDSDAAVEQARDLMGVIAEEARLTSQALAEERGVFPYWQGSVYEAQHMKVRTPPVWPCLPRARSASSLAPARASSHYSPWRTDAPRCSASRPSPKSIRSSSPILSARDCPWNSSPSR